jgi:hypothetical protein
LSPGEEAPRFEAFIVWWISSWVAGAIIFIMSVNGGSVVGG